MLQRTMVDERCMLFSVRSSVNLEAYLFTIGKFIQSVESQKYPDISYSLCVRFPRGFFTRIR